MALEETPLDESTTPLPPQAGGDSLPGQAASLADWADIQPASNIEDEILKARMGDSGFQNYRNLQAAGQTAAAPSTIPAAPSAPAAPAAGGLSNLAGIPPTAMASGVPAGGFNPLFTLLAGQGAEQNIVANNLKVAAAHQQAQLRQQQIADADRVFLEKLQNEPLSVRAPLIQRWAAGQGRVLSDAESAYIANIRPEVMDHTIKMAGNGDVEAQANLKALLGGNTIDMLTAKQTMEARDAEATIKTTEAQYAPRAAEAKITELEAKAKKEGAPKEPTTAYQGDRLAAIESLKSEGVVTPTEPQINKRIQTLTAAQAGETATAREAATTTAATRSMRESAPAVLHFIDKIEDNLKKIETGPMNSRLQSAWAGGVGANDPDFTTYRTNVRLLTTRLMRMHMGARGSTNMFKEFHDLLDESKQTSGNMRAALEAVRDYANETMQEGPTGTSTVGGGLQRLNDLGDVAKLPTGTKFYWQNEPKPRTKN